MKTIGLTILTLSLLISGNNFSKQKENVNNKIVKNISESTFTSNSENNETQDTTIVESKKKYTTEELEKILKNRLDSMVKVVDSLNTITLTESYKEANYVARDNAIDNMHKMCQEFIRKFPNAPYNVKTLMVYKTTWGKEITNELYQLMNKETQQSEEGKRIARFIEINKNPQVGDHFVDFEQTNIHGEKIKFSDIMGKYTLIEFWASWCGPCLGEIPYLLKEYEKYKDQGFKIIGVSLDQDKNNWINAIGRNNLSWENVSDLKGSENEVGLIYGINGIPDNFLIDEDGIIIARKLRVHFLEDKLNELFKEEADK